MITESQVMQFAKNYTDIFDSAVDMGGFHNHVYRIKGKMEFILRVSSSRHRSVDDTIGEVGFLLYLFKNGASVAYPLPGLNGKYVYESEQGDYTWVISAFSVVQGLDWRNRGDDATQWLTHIGKELGRIHRLARAYSSGSHSLRRQWFQSQHLVKADDIFKRYNPRLADVYSKFLSEIKQLPQDGAGFGLIHGDFLFSNYHIDGVHINVFDFDECEYSWFIYDIAVCLYYYLLGGDPSELSGKKKEAEEMLYHLLNGYLHENRLDEYWIKNIDLFFQMREFVLLSTVMENPTEELQGWQKSFFDGAIDRQLNQKAFIEADFTRVYTRLLNEHRQL